MREGAAKKVRESERALRRNRFHVLDKLLLARYHDSSDSAAWQNQTFSMNKPGLHYPAYKSWFQLIWHLVLETSYVLDSIVNAVSYAKNLLSNALQLLQTNSYGARLGCLLLQKQSLFSLFSSMLKLFYENSSRNARLLLDLTHFLSMTILFRNSKTASKSNNKFSGFWDAQFGRTMYDVKTFYNDSSQSEERVHF